MAGISKEERERRRLAALADTLPPPVEAEPMRTQFGVETERSLNASLKATVTAADVLALHRPADAPKTKRAPDGKLESRHWPGLFYSPADPEPEQNNMLGTKDPVWRSWFERNGGKI
jgi:hypothetical protein